MSWNTNHSISEKFAEEAQTATRAGDLHRADTLYRDAAQKESEALGALSAGKLRTRGITAVSAVSLWYKGRDYTSAERFAYRCLADEALPAFAQKQIRNLLQMIWLAAAAADAGVKFIRGDVMVSVKGGQVIHGAAPLDLVLQKVDGIQSLLFRTVEMLFDRPFRRRGSPTIDIQEMFKPWLVQAPAGSYQFAVRMQEPEQGMLFLNARPKLERVTATFFQILRAAATAPDSELAAIVPNEQYRDAFLNLSRNLAPTGKAFNQLDVSEASAPTESLVSLSLDSRQGLNAALRKIRPAPLSQDETVQIRGVLRAVHLDQDWLEVTTTDEPEPRHIKIVEAGEALDDVIGPMVNRRVIAHVIRRGQKNVYKDIETEE